MKAILRVALAMSLLLVATGSFAWGGGNNNWGPFSNNGWGNNNYNPYDEWDPRYWMEEMENTFDDDNYYGGGPNGYGGAGSYGPPPGYYGPNYGPRPYGPPPGYAPNNGPRSYGPNYGPRPYGPPPGYAPRGPAPQQAPAQ